MMIDIQNHKPKYIFHGHQHINKITIAGTTIIIGVHGGLIFDLETGERKEILKIEA